jgi:phage tail-like protein
MADPRKDPLPAFCFKVKLDELPDDLFFKSVGGLKFETEVVDYRAGGVNHSTYKLVGATKWPNLVFKRGFTQQQPQLIEWRSMWLKPEPGKLKRKGGTITQFDTRLLTPMAEWTFVEGWPCKFELSELDAAKNEIVIETLEIAHHGLSFTKK